MGLVHKNNDLHCAGRPKAIPRTFMPRLEAAAAEAVAADPFAGMGTAAAAKAMTVAADAKAETAAAEAAEVAAEASRSSFGGGFG